MPSDQRVLDALPPDERIKTLLRACGLSLQDVAKTGGWWAEQVGMCIRGQRPYPEIRDAIATELREFGVTREDLDRWIDGDAETAA